MSNTAKSTHLLAYLSPKRVLRVGGEGKGMAKRIGYFEYGQVYPPPLVDGTPPVVTEPDTEQPVTLGAPWWAIGWYIAHATILGAVFVT